MKQLGLSYKRARLKARILSNERIKYICSYLCHFSEALDFEKKGGRICVYMDESYIHTTHSTSYGYYFKEQRSGQSASKGRRLIIVHAICKDGPLVELMIMDGPLMILFGGVIPLP
uniref:Uncharacterized protein n=1 Tax=Corethron hystrix TaxID=216773 RepID=A0A7S1FYW6_9STRA|mmetsp:Transcript_42935/g.100789  ORF Transcript_42935/g.100789 Transcript_42935/m.100789 type:complete len:116 (+) Transcript_42935:500-847(+)